MKRGTGLFVFFSLLAAGGIALLVWKAREWQKAEPPPGTTPLPAMATVWQEAETPPGITPLPAMATVWQEAETPWQKAAVTTLDNTERVELLDIDPVLLMPRTIVIRRQTKVAK